MTDTTPAAIEALPREIARDIISGLMHAASYRSDRLQQTAAIDAAIAFVSTVPALAAERDAAQQERDDARGDLLFMTENRNKWQDSATQRYFRAEKAEAEAAALRDEVTRLKEAEAWQLKMRADAMTRRHMNAPEDPHVAALCERHGYGAVIDAASRLWARKDSLGAFYVGGCIGFRSDDEARAALTSKGGEG